MMNENIKITDAKPCENIKHRKTAWKLKVNKDDDGKLKNNKRQSGIR